MKISQKGVSLISVFFIMTIMLAVVLGLSVLLIGQIKNKISSENSLAAFYVADSGVEKMLYYNRQRIPALPEEGIVGGICSICSLSDSGTTDCSATPGQGDETGCVFCKNCQVSYITEIEGNKKYYKTEVRVVPNGIFYNMDVSVRGFYSNTSRAIGLQIINRDLSSSAPEITVLPLQREGYTITVSANIPGSIDEDTVWAHIKSYNDPNGSDVDIFLLNRSIGDPDNYSGSRNLPDDGGYYYYVSACDTQLVKNCGQSDRFPTIP